MPANAVYRTNTEQIVSARAAIVASVSVLAQLKSGLISLQSPNPVSTSRSSRQTPNVQEVEKKIGCGQIEEVIVQAENELLLARKMLGWKPWESLLKPAPPTQWQWPPAQIKALPH